MTNTNNLRKIIEEDSIEIYDFPLRGRNKGLYIDGSIALSDKIVTETEKWCVLAEEIGHHKTSYGNTLDLKNEISRKQEHRARGWAYEELIPFSIIIEAFGKGCRSWFELAEHIGVTEDFLKDAIVYFKNKHGIYKVVDNYIVYFEPFGVMQRLE